MHLLLQRRHIDGHGGIIAKCVVTKRAADIGTIVFVDDVARTNIAENRNKLVEVTKQAEEELASSLAKGCVALNENKTVHLSACRGPGAYRRLQKLVRKLPGAQKEAMYLGPTYCRAGHFHTELAK